MRPRPDAAENCIRPCLPCGRAGRFNEAAARCRGKRPPRARTATPRARPCFNEAAARCRGKRAMTFCTLAKALCFNEAAARCRGKR